MVKFYTVSDPIVALYQEAFPGVSDEASVGSLNLISETLQAGNEPAPVDLQGERSAAYNRCLEMVKADIAEVEGAETPAAEAEVEVSNLEAGDELEPADEEMAEGSEPGAEEVNEQESEDEEESA